MRVQAPTCPRPERHAVLRRTKRSEPLCRSWSSVYRYRLIDEETGDDIGPLISLRLTFAVGEEIARRSGERYVVRALVEPENENLRANVVVCLQ
jgi:hypothetical protein